MKKDDAYHHARQLAARTRRDAIVYIDPEGRWQYSPGSNTIARARAAAIIRPPKTTNATRRRPGQ